VKRLILQNLVAHELPALDELQRTVRLFSMRSSKQRIEIRTANGKVFRVTDPSTKQLDPKLKEASRLRAYSILTGMRKARQEARKRGVRLSEVLQVS
jgi:hypothetical protein